MTHLARVTCPDCLGESSDARAPFCGWCHSQGHLDIDRAHDGTVPEFHPDGRPVLPWVDSRFPFPDSFTPRPHDATQSSPESPNA